MVRRKRDDDSSAVTFHSSLGGGGMSGNLRVRPASGAAPPALDGASSTAAESQPSLAFDASSMSAAGSHRGGGGGHRPHKRRRNTLTDALQKINLNRDVPQQILDGGAGGVEGMSCTAISDAIDGDDSSLLVNRGTSSSGGRDVDDDDDDVASGLLLGLNGAEDYDDNSQLTASDDDDDEATGAATKAGAQGTGGKRAASEDMDAVEDSDDDEIERHENMNSMNDVEKAQGKAMIDLLVGKNRLVNFSGMEKAAVASTTSAIDRKIEELLRQSLQNVQQGAHPLDIKQATPTTEDDDDEVSLWTSQDDMAIDPRVYHNTSWSTTKGGRTKDQNNNDQNIGSIQPPPIRTRKRSNSLPNSMDIDVDYTDNNGDQKTVRTIPCPSPPNAARLPPQCFSMAIHPSSVSNMMASSVMPDVEMD